MQKLKFYLNILFLISLSLVASCLPLQKKTQCGDNEAFNPTRRQCVPVVGASTTSTVFISSKTPSNSYTTDVSGAIVSHSAAVSDVYEYGYSTHWVLHYNNNTTIINDQVMATNTLSYNFNPANLFGVGNYVLELILFDEDGSNQLDSITWTIVIDDEAPPELVTPSPASTAFSYDTDDTSVTHSLQLNNPDSQAGNFTWYIDGMSVGSGSFTSLDSSLSTTFNPQTLGTGLHTVELELTSSTGMYFDSYTWTINVTDPDLPIITTTTPDHLNAIDVIDGISFVAGGYRDASNVALTQICVDIDDWDKNSDGISDVDVQFLVSGTSVHSGTFTASNQYCYNNFPTITLSNPDIGEAKQLTIKTVRAGTSTLVDYRLINLSVRPKNIRPIISISDTNTSSGLGCTSSSDVYYTGCTMVQSVNLNQDTEGAPYDFTDTNVFGSSDDIDNQMSFALSLDYDPDISAETDFEVIFQMKKVTDAFYSDMDTTNAYTTSDCVYSAADTKGSISNKGICTLNMDAFNANGPIEPGNYIIKAFIRDTGSTWAPGNQKESNTVTWELAVTEYQSNAIDIADQQLTAPAAAGESWIEESNASCTSTSNLLNTTTPGAENGYIIVHTAVTDFERDDFYISISMSNGVLGVGNTSVVPTTLVSRIDNDLTYTVSNCFKVPEWAVSGAASDIVDITVQISDKPDTETAQSATKTFEVLINNNNPVPTFADNSDVDYSSGGATPKYVVAGFPFTIDPPSYTDASLYDGKNVTWQWQVSTDGTGTTWSDIPEANSDNMSNTTLVWTPDPHTTLAAEQLYLRLCLGDDGYGNDTDCSNASATKVYQGITVYPSVHTVQASIADNSSGSELASWYDPVDDVIYVAYTTGTNIFVEKLSFDSNGQWQTDHSISFSTEEPTKTSVTATNLSMDGYNDGSAVTPSGNHRSLLIAYQVTTAVTETPEFRVRRIYIDNGKLSFHYVGLYNSTNTTGDLISTDANFDAGASVSEGANADQTVVTFTDFATLNTTPGTITINSQTLTYATDYCNPTCSDNVDAASELEAAINNHATLSKELVATHSGGSSLTIYGFPRADYYDEVSEITPVIGDIKIDDASPPNWYLPYSNAFSSLSLYVAKGTNANQHLTSTVVAHSSITSNTFNQEIANTFTPGGELAIAAKGSSGNLDLYTLDPATLAVNQTQLGVFNLDGYQEVQNISVSSKMHSNGLTELIWVSGLSLKSDGVTFLNAAVFDASDFTTYAQNPDFATYPNSYITSLDKVQISARAGMAEEAVVTLTTNALHSNPNEAHLLKLTADIATPAISLKDYNGPKLNNNDTVEGAVIFATPIFADITRGSVGATSSENEKDSLFFMWHEDDGGNQIQSGIFNIEDENITTQSTGVNGSYPANLVP